MNNYTATIINQAIINNDSKSVKLDETCKVLLSDVQILAHILKYVVDELNNFTIEEIQTIIPAHISHEPVFPGNRVAKTNSNESIILGEGLLRFDVHFELNIPGTNTRLQINIEAQNSIYSEYEIVTRGIAYTSRLISQQFKTVIRANKYQKMQKIYSIWLLPQAPLKEDGTIRSYKLQEKVASGKPLNNQEAYDKIKIVTIYTSNKHVISKKYEANDALLRPLMLLFGMNGASAREIIKILEKEYNFKMSTELKGGVENMCNLAQGLIIEGKTEEKYKILINLLEQTDISLKKIMEIVGLVKKEEINEMIKRLLDDLKSKEGYINGKPTTITIDRIINEKMELV